MTQFIIILAIWEGSCSEEMTYDHLTIVEKPPESQICVPGSCCSSLPTQTKQKKPDPVKHRPCKPLSALVFHYETFPLPQSLPLASLRLAVSWELAVCEADMSTLFSSFFHLSPKVWRHPKYCTNMNLFSWFKPCQLLRATVKQGWAFHLLLPL